MPTNESYVPMGFGEAQVGPAQQVGNQAAINRGIQNANTAAANSGVAMRLPNEFAVTQPSLGLSNITPTSKVVSSSTPVQDVIDNLNTKLNKAVSTDPTQNAYTGLTDTYTQNAKLISDRQDVLAQRRNDEIARINQDFAQTQAKLETSQRQEAGSSARNLTYMQQGGQSASAQAYLDSLGVQHQSEIAALGAKRSAAISAAQAAYEDKDFELVNQLLTEARDIEKTVYQRNQDFINTTLNIKSSMREDLTQAYNMNSEQRKIAEEDRAAAREVSKLAFEQGLLPDSQFFTIGGEIYRSTGERLKTKAEALAAGVAPDLSNVQQIQVAKKKQEYSAGIIGEYEKFLEDVSAGKEKYMTFNQFQTVDANRKASIAKASSGPKITATELRRQKLDSEIARYSKNLNALTGSDGYVSPSDFKLAYRAWTAEGNSGQTFIKEFAQFVNPDMGNAYGNLKVYNNLLDE